jgi:hypothetical protein
VDELLTPFGEGHALNTKILIDYCVLFLPTVRDKKNYSFLHTCLFTSTPLTYSMYKLLFPVIQGVPEVLERFCKAISQEPLGLQKRHTCQKMRLIFKFCLEN